MKRVVEEKEDLFPGVDDFVAEFGCEGNFDRDTLTRHLDFEDNSGKHLQISFSPLTESFCAKKTDGSRVEWEIDTYYFQDIKIRNGLNIADVILNIGGEEVWLSFFVWPEIKFRIRAPHES